MSRTSTLILLGILVILVPFSGLPIAVRSFLSVIFGACVLGIGFALRARDVRMKKAQSVAETPAAPDAPAASVEAERQEPQGVSPI